MQMAFHFVQHIHSFANEVFEVYNNISIEKNRLNSSGVNFGDYTYISAGTGYSKCSLSLEDGYDANITSLKGVIGFNATETQVSGNLYVNGRILNAVTSQANGYVSSKVPISFGLFLLKVLIILLMT